MGSEARHARLRGAQPTRLETFVDAAFAFALTMLVISVEHVPETFSELLEALKRVPSFAASFAIVVMFWHGHYRWSRRYGIEDTRSVLLSLLLVFLVLVFLYPLRMMMSGAFHSITGGALPTEVRIEQLSDIRAFFFLYGFAFASMCAVVALLFDHARRSAPSLEPPLSAYEHWGAVVEVQAWTILCAMGAASAALALALPPKWLPASVWLYASLAVVMPVLGQWWRRREAQILAQAQREAAPVTVD